MPATRVAVLVGAAALLLLGGAALPQASLSATPTTTITNETWEPNTTEFVALNHSFLNNTEYNDTVSVFDENGTEMTAGDDYEWNGTFEEGTIHAVSGGELDGDANATVTYRFQQPTQTQGALWQVFLVPLFSGSALLFVLALALILGVIKVFST